MPFCASCGAAVEGRFCPKCGSAQPAGAAAPPPVQPQYASQQQYTPPPPAVNAGMADNVAGALCYLLGLVTGILFLVLAPYNQNKTIRFHAFQSIFFHVAWIGIWIVLSIIIAVGHVFLIASALSMLLWLGGLVVWILLMVKAYQNQKFKLPVIGDLAEKQA